MKKIARKAASASRPTAKQNRQLARLAALPDATIDYSDIPPLTEEFWQRAVRNPFYRPLKQQLTVRLDADIIAWLRVNGKGYQTRLNQILRALMLREIPGKRRHG